MTAIFFIQPVLPSHKPRAFRCFIIFIKEFDCGMICCLSNLSYGLVLYNGLCCVQQNTHFPKLFRSRTSNQFMEAFRRREVAPLTRNFFSLCLSVFVVGKFGSYILQFITLHYCVKLSICLLTMTTLFLLKWKSFENF